MQTMPMPWLVVSRDNNSTDGNTTLSFIDPTKELNAGLWCLFGGATVFLGLRIWVKLTRSHGLWYDDCILIASWLVLLVNDVLICWEYANGYVSKTGKWDTHMHIIINITSCGTLIGQAWSKTAFGVMLLRMSNKWQKYILWFCMVTMNIYMIVKCILQWAKVCDKSGDYQASYRLNFCIYSDFRDKVKEGGQVYNIIMDFVFALFPWMITWKLNLRRKEKIALCATLSLGAVIAIITAVRTAWKENGNKHDPWYYWNNAMSNIWYSSEVAGTILVQCIPVLRPFLREVHNSLTSRKLGSSENDGQSTTFQSTGYSCKISGNRHSYNSYKNVWPGGKHGEFIKLQSVRNGSELEDGKGGGLSDSDIERAILVSHTTTLLRSDPGPLQESERKDSMPIKDVNFA